jgi:hypothetical protein
MPSRNSIPYRSRHKWRTWSWKKERGRPSRKLQTPSEKERGCPSKLRILSPGIHISSLSIGFEPIHRTRYSSGSILLETSALSSEGRAQAGILPYLHPLRNQDEN